jgi:hypothetical protein
MTALGVDVIGATAPAGNIAISVAVRVIDLLLLVSGGCVRSAKAIPSGSRDRRSF